MALLKTQVKKDGKGLDPFIKVAIGSKHTWKSQTIKKGSLNNDFKNEKKTFALTDKDSTIITFSFYDKKALSADDLLGSATYDLKNHKATASIKLKLMTAKKQQLGTLETGISLVGTTKS